MGHVWKVTCASAAMNDKLVVQVELRVKRKKCNIVEPDSREIKLTLLWLPQRIKNRKVSETLALFGVVRSITQEKRRYSGK